MHRAYRYGQSRPVYIYRLIAEGMEQCLYRQQVVKLQLSGRVLDEHTLESAFSTDELKAFWKPMVSSQANPNPNPNPSPSPNPNPNPNPDP